MRKRIAIDDFILFFLGIYLLFLEISEYSIFYNISLLALLFSFILSFIKKPKINLNIFLISILLYIVYQIILLMFHIPLSNQIFFRDIRSLFIIFMVLFVIYNIIVNDGRPDKILKLFISVTLIALIIIVISSRDTLFTQRLSHSYNHQAASFYLFGVPIYMSSNAFSFELAVAFLLSIYYYKKENKKKHLITALLFVIGVLLTGSRKGFLVLFLFIIWWINELNKQKYLKKTFIALLVIGFSYYSIMNIPILYNSIGERIVILQKYIFYNDVNADVRNRDTVKKLAMNKIIEKPITGYGEGAFQYFFDNVTSSNSENNYLELLIHGGIIGLFIYYLYLFDLLKNITKEKNKTRLNNMLIMILITMLIIEFGSVHYNSMKMLLFIILYFANRKIEKKVLKKETTVNE